MMDGQKVLEVISVYREYFEKKSVPKLDLSHSLLLDYGDPEYGDLVREQALAHCHRKLDQMEEFIAQDRLEKAFRWLGFVQGVLWLSGCYTLEDLKNHNRPNAVS